MSVDVLFHFILIVMVPCAAIATKHTQKIQSKSQTFTCMPLLTLFIKVYIH